MRRLRCLLAVVAVAAPAGCSSEDGPRMSPECTAGPDAVEAALARAPDEVRLDGGVALSACVRFARTDAELQNLGLALTEVAERLEPRARDGDDRAALQLGYLIGAARKGAPSESSLQAELVYRLERSAAFGGSSGSLAEGMRAGESRG